MNRMQTHISVLGWLYIALNALMALIALFLFILLAGIGVAVNEPEAAMILSIVGFVAGAFLIILALPGIIGGIGLLKRKGWARILVLILGCLNLVNFPIGTALGVYTIWALIQEDAEEIFANK